eukprot:m.37802 g.37802  ORF g.37802 m.37802 type:complete len:452 (+) comp14594_c0_seq1:556-1911(+)
MPKRSKRAQVYEDAPDSDDEPLLELGPANDNEHTRTPKGRQESRRDENISVRIADRRSISPLRITYAESPGHTRRPPPRETCGGNSFLKGMSVTPVVLAMLCGIGGAMVSSFIYVDSGTLCSHTSCFSMGFWKVKDLNTILDVVTGMATEFPVGTCEAFQQIPTTDSDGSFIGTIQESVATATAGSNCSIGPNNTDALNCINMCRQEYKVAYDAETARFSVASVMNTTLANGHSCFTECSAMGYGTAKESGPVTLRFDLHSDPPDDWVYQVTLAHDVASGTITSNLTATGGNTSAVHCSSGDYIVTGGTVLGISTGDGTVDDTDDEHASVAIGTTCLSGLVSRCRAGRGFLTAGTVTAAASAFCGIRWALGTGRRRLYRCFVGFASLALVCFTIVFSIVISYVHGIGGDNRFGCALPDYFQQFDLKYGESFALYVAASVCLLLTILVALLC